MSEDHGYIDTNAFKENEDPSLWQDYEHPAYTIMSMENYLCACYRGHLTDADGYAHPILFGNIDKRLVFWPSMPGAIKEIEGIAAVAFFHLS